MAQIVMTMAGVDGECALDGFVGKIACKSMSMSASQGMDASKNQTRTVSTVTVEEITLERDFDTSSIPLLDRMISAKDCGQVILHFLKAAGTDGVGQVEFLTITLEHVLVSSVEHSVSMEENPSETITLNFSAIKWEYMAQAVESTLGGVKPTNFDLQLGKKV